MDKEVVYGYIEYYVTISQIYAAFSVNLWKNNITFFSPKILN